MVAGAIGHEAEGGGELAARQVVTDHRVRSDGEADACRGGLERQVEVLQGLLRRRPLTTCLEVVSTDPAQALASARVAVDLGVDLLMGGTEVEETLSLLRSSATGYLPFVGRPFEHPTRLAGHPERIAEDCRRAEAAGCAGVDLLAYRATEADPLDLVRAARAATTGRLVVAGSITGAAQIRDLTAAGADAFTIGSAAFDGSLRPHAGGLRSQLSLALDAVRTTHVCA